MDAIDSPMQAVAQLLQEQQPATLLICSSDNIPGVEQYTAESHCVTTILNAPEEVRTLPEAARFELVIIADQLEHLPKPAGIELLGKIRNVHSNHFCVLYSPEGTTAAWTAVDFFSLGMTLAHTFHAAKRELQLYTYAIENYNHKREWNNSRFWANPENFDKYWW